MQVARVPQQQLSVLPLRTRGIIRCARECLQRLLREAKTQAPATRAGADDWPKGPGRLFTRVSLKVSRRYSTVEFNLDKKLLTWL